MLAVSYSAPGSMPVLDSWPDPVCPEDGVVVRVGASGVCRSDWHAWMGRVAETAGPGAWTGRER